MRLIPALPALLLVMFICSSASANVGIDEKLGSTLPADITLINETGAEVKLASLINGPTILSLVYFGCRDMCPLIMSGQATLANNLDMPLGTEYRMITVSFDERDTPQDAHKASANYLAMLKSKPAEGSWRFLTASKDQIDALADSVGFRFQRTGDGFTHTAALMFISPKGKVARYIYGVSFLPFDAKMALLEASREQVGVSSKSVLLYCFRYDPEGKRYVFDLLKVAGTLTLIFAIIILMYMLRAGRRRKQELGEDE